MPYYNHDFLVVQSLSQGVHSVLALMDATKLSMGAVYCSLNRLEKKGITTSKVDENSKSQLGSYRRKYYYLK